MERELKIGQHVVFIDEHRRERDALLTAIHGDPQGRSVVPIRKAVEDLTDEERKSGEWEIDSHKPAMYAYKLNELGHHACDYGPVGESWPCVNLVVIADNEDAQDQYGRQIDDRHTSIVHHSDNTAIGYCYRFVDEEIDWSKMQKTIS